MTIGNDLIEFTELRTANPVANLVAYILEKLPEFSDSDEFINILEKKKNENQHSLSFCVYMTNKCDSKYYFARENSQLGSSVIDIGVYKGSVLIFTIEAKILPTPKGSFKTPRISHEYVYGKGAGIQRFKDGKHGLDNLNNPLDQSGLIGFLKERDTKYWFNQINTWINDANWGITEELRPVITSKYNFLISRHTRLDNSKIDLYHFLMDVI